MLGRQNLFQCGCGSALASKRITVSTMLQRSSRALKHLPQCLGSCCHGRFVTLEQRKKTAAGAASTAETNSSSPRSHHCISRQPATFADALGAPVVAAIDNGRHEPLLERVGAGVDPEVCALQGKDREADEQDQPAPSWSARSFTTRACCEGRPTTSKGSSGPELSSNIMINLAHVGTERRPCR